MGSSIISWICPLCEHANIDSFESCINCNIHRDDIPYEKYNCWSFNKCKVNKKWDCDVFTKDLGKRCFTVQNMKKGCKGNKEKTCYECEWYDTIVKNEEIE